VVYEDNPCITALGGGTGLSTMLRGLKHYTSNITAIVTMADDGGGSGRLRQDLGMLPPGDIRNCLLALSNIEPIMEKLLRYRFDEGILKGQSFGNLLIAAMNGIYGNFEEAIHRTCDVLAVKGKVIPVTIQDIRMCALFEDGSEVLGESKIPKAKIQNGSRIKSVSLVPNRVMPAKHVIESIEEAELLILGPGSLYTSVIPNLLVEGVADAIRASRAPKIYVCNVMTQPGETDGYTAFDHVSAILEHAGEGIIDYCIVNTGKVIPEILGRYTEDGAQPVLIDEKKFESAGINLIMSDITDCSSDYARHNPNQLAFEIAKFLSSKSKNKKTREYLKNVIKSGVAF